MKENKINIGIKVRVLAYNLHPHIKVLIGYIFPPLYDLST
jgi:hypothetical protein